MQSADVASPPAASQASPDLGGVNCEHYSKVQDALNAIEAVPELADIRGAPPSLVSQGAVLAPFKPELFAVKMNDDDRYLCGHNLFLTNPLRDASPGVPIDTNEVQKLCDHFFKDVFNISKLPTIEIGLDHKANDLNQCNLQRVSPCEHVHALIFACARDMKAITVACQQTELPLDDDTAASQMDIKKKWALVLTSIPTVFRLLPTESAKFFASVQSRIDTDVEAKAIARKPAQWAMEVVLHKARMHRAAGTRHPPGAGAVAEDLLKNINWQGTNDDETSVYENMSKNFVDNCLTIYDRVLKIPELLKIIMKRRQPWDKVLNIHTLCSKAGSRENIQWVLELIDDATERGYMSVDEVTGRSLKGTENSGLVLVLLAKRALRDQLFQVAQKEFASGWKPEELVKMKKAFNDLPAFRESLRNLTWQRGFAASQLRFVELLEQVLASADLDKELKQRLINKEGAADWVERMPEVDTAMNAIKALFKKENECEEETADSSTKQAEGNEPVVVEDDLNCSDAGPVVRTPEHEVAAKLFPKTPLSLMAPWITLAQRKVMRNCDLIVDTEECVWFGGVISRARFKVSPGMSVL